MRAYASSLYGTRCANGWVFKLGSAGTALSSGRVSTPPGSGFNGVAATPSGGVSRNCWPALMVAGSMLFHPANSRKSTPCALAMLNSVSPCFTVYTAPAGAGDGAGTDGNGVACTPVAGLAADGAAATGLVPGFGGGVRSVTGAG